MVRIRAVSQSRVLISGRGRRAGRAARACPFVSPNSALTPSSSASIEVDIREKKRWSYSIASDGRPSTTMQQLLLVAWEVAEVNSTQQRNNNNNNNTRRITRRGICIKISCTTHVLSYYPPPLALFPFQK